MEKTAPREPLFLMIAKPRAYPIRGDADELMWQNYHLFLPLPLPPSLNRQVATLFLSIFAGVKFVRAHYRVKVGDPYGVDAEQSKA